MYKVLVCHPCAQLFNIPCVVQLTESIARDEEHAVHFARMNSSRSETPNGEFSSKVVSHNYPFKIRARKESIFHWLIGYSLYTLFLSISIKPDLFVGMGSKGLLVAWVLSQLTAKKLFYYNLEFYSTDRRPLRNRIWNKVERALLKRCSLLIIHDKNRCKIYKDLIGYQDIKCEVFPNTPISTDVTNAHMTRVKSICKIADKNRYLIYAGGLYRELGLDKLCRCLDQLPNEWCLILQSYDGVDEIMRTDNVLKLLSSNRLVINSNPLSPSEYSALLSMCDIGIAFYGKWDLNMRNVGLSSGKIAAYWKHGLPVLVNDIPFYSELLSFGKGGAIYYSYDEITSPLLSVIADYDAHHQGALFLFKKYFSLDSYSRVINDTIKELTSSC